MDVQTRQKTILIKNSQYVLLHVLLHILSEPPSLFTTQLLLRASTKTRRSGFHLYFHVRSLIGNDEAALHVGVSLGEI